MTDETTTTDERPVRPMPKSGKKAKSSKDASREALTGETKTKKSAPKECLDGCGGVTQGGKFLPGHDAKLKSSLLKDARGDDKAKAKKATDRLTELGWDKFLVTTKAKAKKQLAEEKKAAEPEATAAE